MEPKDFSVLQVCVRGVFVFFATLCVVRVANKRFLSKLTAFDTVLGFVLASALARAINGSGPMVPRLVGCLVLVLLHRVLSAASFHLHWVGRLIKGSSEILVENGLPRQAAMRRHRISEQDLLEEARLNGKVLSLNEVQTATLERSGEVSVISRK